MTHLFQKFCLVVYPVMEENPEPAGPQQSDDEDWKKLL